MFSGEAQHLLSFKKVVEIFFRNGAGIEIEEFISISRDCRKENVVVEGRTGDCMNTLNRVREAIVRKITDIL